MVNKERRKRKIYIVLLYIITITVAIIISFPFLWMILASFKEQSEFYLLKPTLLPKHFNFDNFKQLFGKLSIGIYYKNSIIVTVAQVITTLTIVLLAGYGFAKYSFKGKKILFLIVLSSTMIPWVATIIPLYILASNFNLVDTMGGLIIPGMADAFSIFLARNFMSAIPTPLLEAARLDGAGELKIFNKVVLPSVKPLISVIAINKIVSSWNAFQWPLLVVNSDKLRTLPLAVAKLSSQFYDAYNLKMAAAAIAVLPVLILYAFFQRYLVEGVSLTGIK